MSDLGIDLSTYDLVTDARGDAGPVDGVYLIAQRIAVAVQTGQGEWAFDTSYGVDYHGTILGKYEAASVEAEFRRVVEETPGVLRVEGYRAALARGTRQLTVTFTAITEAGPLEVVAEALDVAAPAFALLFNGPGGTFTPGWT